MRKCPVKCEWQITRHPVPSWPKTHYAGDAFIGQFGTKAGDTTLICLTIDSATSRPPERSSRTRLQHQQSRSSTNSTAAVGNSIAAMLVRTSCLRYVCTAFAVMLISNSSVCLAGRDLVSSSATVADFECGKPLGPCGSAIPAAVTCPKGKGWCPAGYFCGWDENALQQSRCLPLPEKCGLAGNACCPSNTNSPHISMEDKVNRKPYCKDGSVCFYFKPLRPGDTDIFAGNQGAYACAKVADDCGTGLGKPCCPMPYRVPTNPPLKRIGCEQVPNAYCDYDPDFNLTASDPKAMQPNTGARPGVCTAQAAKCGMFGNPCCMSSGTSRNEPAVVATCGAVTGQQPGSRGYCRNPFVDSGFKLDPARPAAFSELVCTKCPDTISNSVEKSNPVKWAACKSPR